jgi:hypothetical protein
MRKKGNQESKLVPPNAFNKTLSDMRSPTFDWAGNQAAASIEFWI